MVLFKWAEKDQIRSSFFLLLWSLSFSLAMLMTKSLSKTVPQISLMLIRSGFGLIVMLPFWYPFSPWNVFCTPNVRLLILRGVFQTLAMALGYAGYRYLPGETAAFLGTSGPFFVLLLARVFLKETLDFPHWIAIISAYIGVIFVLNPFALTLSFYTFLPVFANICMAFSIIVTRKLIVTKENEKRILFSNSFFPLIFFSFASLYFNLSWNCDAFTLCYIAGIGALGALSAVSHFYALRNSSSAFVAIFDYFRLTIFLILNYFIYSEPMNLNARLGGGIIVVSTFLYTILKQKKSNK
ncbi:MULTISPECIES: DMT family transporter [Holospora]|uniref:S-adenosylmethionine uptake transporter n=2 Tax=Holospora TaxID=44747 RepID=A0A061JIH4_9PROT|nr:MULTISPECIES: DMT family transporter [Holospora]ETZ04854.1 S-adenosylmethionine uptake transporter [Holospora undulata HU1]GAJ46103.1 S-adenosylmethionine uptake transporter [Holospora elegans E1]